MELTLKQFSKKWLYIGLSLVCFVLLTSNIIVLADEFGGFYGERLLGMTGVTDGEINIGMSGVLNTLDIGMGGTAHFNPSSGAFQLINLLPFLFISLAAFLIIKTFTSGVIDAKVIFLAAILIYMSVAFLPGMQEMITALLGG